jgi:carboxyl-terminal processing protease
MEGITGLVMDLRRDGGGALDEAVHLTGLFVKRGPVVRRRTGMATSTSLAIATVLLLTTVR